ncbi:hypothetical protein PM082_016406 [Marasmius tenuissimus]|nr:hypothetical protein PM082_016406 [Marasmius tenuissimus]
MDERRTASEEQRAAEYIISVSRRAPTCSLGLLCPAKMNLSEIGPNDSAGGENCGERERTRKDKAAEKEMVREDPKHGVNVL